MRMYKLIILITVLILTSCKNWCVIETKTNKTVTIEQTHIHFYNYDLNEWSCLDLDGGEYEYVEIERYKCWLNKKNLITKAKQIK